jgi:hypothetical protein
MLSKFAYFLKRNPEMHIRNHRFNLFYWSFFQFSNIFRCRPMSMVWKGWDGEHEGHCYHINKLILSVAGYTVALDSIIIILPIREMLRLQLN